MDAAAEQVVSRNRWMLVGGCLVVALLLLGFLQLPRGRAALTAMGLRAAPRDVVELYFPRGGSSSVTPSASTIPVDFVIRVVGEQPVSVSWRLAVGSGSAARTVARGRGQVDPAHPLRLRHAADLRCTRAKVDTRIPVRVSLAPRSQRILRWVSCDSSSASQSTGTTR